MFVFSMRPCQINSQLVNLFSLVGEDQTHLGRHVVQPVVILVVAILVDKNITKWTRFFSASLKVLAACLSLSPTTSSTFPAAQTFPPRLFRPLSRKGRTKDRVKSCLRESHPRCPALHYS